MVLLHKINWFAACRRALFWRVWRSNARKKMFWAQLLLSRPSPIGKSFNQHPNQYHNKTKRCFRAFVLLWFVCVRTSCLDTFVTWLWGKFCATDQKVSRLLICWRWGDKRRRTRNGCTFHLNCETHFCTKIWDMKIVSSEIFWGGQKRTPISMNESQHVPLYSKFANSFGKCKLFGWLHAKKLYTQIYWHSYQHEIKWSGTISRAFIFHF